MVKNRNVIRNILTTVFCLLTTFFALSQGPQWWEARGVVDKGLPPNDYAAITHGQLKWLANGAAEEMNAYFGAGPGVAAVVNAFANSNNYYPANIGQVKYVAQPFYDRLYQLNLTNTFPANMPGYYPWVPVAVNDYAPATIGQAKYVFSFDSGVDSDADGLSDWREAGYGTDPYDPDTDDDGLSDGWEVAHGFDPLNANDGNQVEPIWLEQARSQIVEHWKMIYTAPLVFTNAPGSTEDLNDLKNALLSLSGIFYRFAGP